MRTWGKGWGRASRRDWGDNEVNQGVAKAERLDGRSENNVVAGGPERGPLGGLEKKNEQMIGGKEKEVEGG